MADPKDLLEAADAIRGIRELPAVVRHRELDDPLRQAEDWARKEYRKVREWNGDPDASNFRPPDVSRDIARFQNEPAKL